MAQDIIRRKLREQQKELYRLEKFLVQINDLNPADQPEKYASVTIDAALQAEHLTCSLRSLVTSTSGTTKAEYMTLAAHTHGITIRWEDGIFDVRLPVLLPKKGTGRSAVFLLDPLQYALEQYTKEHPFPRFRECVVCFTHVYREELNCWQLPDYDNLQQKQVLDMIALFIMTDDSGSLCDIYHTSRPGSEPCTHVSVMDKSLFPLWLERQKQAGLSL